MAYLRTYLLTVLTYSLTYSPTHSLTYIWPLRGSTVRHTKQVSWMFPEMFCTNCASNVKMKRGKISCMWLGHKGTQTHQRLVFFRLMYLSESYIFQTLLVLFLELSDWHLPYILWLCCGPVTFRGRDFPTSNEQAKRANASVWSGFGKAWHFYLYHNYVIKHSDLTALEYMWNGVLVCRERTACQCREDKKNITILPQKCRTGKHHHNRPIILHVVYIQQWAASVWRRAETRWMLH